MDEEGAAWFSQMLEKSIGFLCRSVRVCLDDNIYIGSGFETCLFAVLVSHNVFDTNLPIEIVTFLNTDLRFLCFAWNDGVDHFLYGAMHLLPLLLAHGEPPA